MRRTTDFFL
jgi:hypothetical protein